MTIPAPRRTTAALLMTAAALLVTACAPQPGAPSSMQILQGYNPEFVTVQAEIAKTSAMKSPAKLAVSAGQYCSGFRTTVRGQSVTGRVELNMLPGTQYLLGMRYTAGQTVWSRTQGGVYALKGHALTLLSASGTELTYPVTTITADGIELWGDLPLTREACTAAPLEGELYSAAVTAARKDLTSPYPW